MIGIDHRYVLQERDRVLLRFLSDFRVIDREQAKCAAGFGSASRVNVRLLALCRMGLLERVFISNSGASRKAIYMLTRKGAAVAGVAYRRVRLFENSLLGVDLALNHQLNVNATYLRLRKVPNDLLLANWKTFDTPVSSSIRLKPDGYFEYTTDVTRSAFLEIDMGTETKKTWTKKVTEYLRLAVSGEFSRVFHQPHFRTLIVATTEQRLTNILRVVAQQTDKIFFGTTFNRIASESFWSAIWMRPGRTDRVSLL
jgi:hypothetical protein